jgi:hypothetical protein
VSNFGFLKHGWAQIHTDDVLKQKS